MSRINKLLLVVIVLAFVIAQKFSSAQQIIAPLIRLPFENIAIPSPFPKFISEINNGPRDKKQIAFTFDADMTPSMLADLKSGRIKSWYNRQVVDVLIEKQVPATLFITGLWAQSYPDVVKSLSQNPLFEIGNHSNTHPSFTPDCYTLTYVSASQQADQFEKSQRILKDITGQEPKLFRFPGGCHTSIETVLANRYGLTVVGWDVASVDAFNTNSLSIIHKVESQSQNGSIVVFHLHGNRNAPKTAEVLPELIEYFKSRGFNFVKVSQLLPS